MRLHGQPFGAVEHLHEHVETVVFSEQQFGTACGKFRKGNVFAAHDGQTFAVLFVHRTHKASHPFFGFAGILQLVAEKVVE